MGKKSLIMSVAFFFSLTMLTAPARAGCIQGDLLGLWNGEIWYPDGIVKENWSQFTIWIDSYGNIKKGLMTYPSGKRVMIMGGHLKVDAECVIQGTVEVGTEIIQISHGGINTDNLGNAVLLLGVARTTNSFP